MSERWKRRGAEDAEIQCALLCVLDVPVRLQSAHPGPEARYNPCRRTRPPERSYRYNNLQNSLKEFLAVHKHGDWAIVDQFDIHHCLEFPRRRFDATRFDFGNELFVQLVGSIGFRGSNE